MSQSDGNDQKLQLNIGSQMDPDVVTVETGAVNQSFPLLSGHYQQI